MAIKAGRVGVNPSDVDSHGHIRGGGGGGSSYTKQETDALLNAKADKTMLGGLEFRNNDGAPQVKVGSDWVNFSGGGSAPVLLWQISDTSALLGDEEIIVDGYSDYNYLLIVCNDINAQSQFLVAPTPTEDFMSWVAGYANEGSQNVLVGRYISTRENNKLYVSKTVSRTSAYNDTKNHLKPIKIYGVNISI